MQLRNLAPIATAVIIVTASPTLWAGGHHPSHHHWRGHPAHHTIRTPFHGHRHAWRGQHRHAFHRRHHHPHISLGFTLRTAPFGRIVTHLPAGYVAVHIGGRPYYTYRGWYYRPAPLGYEVITAPRPVAESDETVVVQVPTLNVRAGPGKTFEIVGQLSRGTSLPVHGTAPGWYYVELSDGHYGWIATEYATHFITDASG